MTDKEIEYLLLKARQLELQRQLDKKPKKERIKEGRKCKRETCSNIVKNPDSDYCNSCLHEIEYKKWRKAHRGFKKW